jgi:hypothetical protein
LRKRGVATELVLRFFAYSDRYVSFRHDVDNFLNKYAQDNRTTFETKRLSDEFDRMLVFVEKYFPYGFAKTAESRATPRVRFEAIAVGANLALRKNPNLVPRDMSWLKSDKFVIHTTTHASNSLPRLRGRVEYVRDQLLAALP